MALGQTLDGMRVWDIRRAVQMIHFIRDADVAKVEITASGPMGVNALYASLFESSVRRIEFEQPAHVHTPKARIILACCGSRTSRKCWMPSARRL